MPAKNKAVAILEPVEPLVREIRNERVMLDTDLARIYGVTTGALNRAVKRNRERFPEDFMFQLTADEADSLRCQTGTLKVGRGQHRKFRPFAFTEPARRNVRVTSRSRAMFRVNFFRRTPRGFSASSHASGSRARNTRPQTPPRAAAERQIQDAL